MDAVVFFLLKYIFLGEVLRKVSTIRFAANAYNVIMTWY